MRSKYAFLLALPLAAASAGAHSRIYMYVDAEGVKHYTDVPDNNRYRLLALSPADLTRSGEHYSPTLLARAAAYDAIIERAARTASVEPNLLRAVIVVESGFNPGAVSKKGAVGLMQLQPATARRYGVKNIYDPEQNVRAGAHYLSDLLIRFDSNLELALAAYNAGEEAVERYHRRVPPFRETLAYVPSVMKVYRKLMSQAQASI